MHDHNPFKKGYDFLKLAEYSPDLKKEVVQNKTNIDKGHSNGTR